MTITLNLHQDTIIRDLQTLHTIFEAEHIELVEPLRTFLQPLNISSREFSVGNIAIQVTPKEFALIGVFNGGLS